MFSLLRQVVEVRRFQFSMLAEKGAVVCYDDGSCSEPAGMYVTAYTPFEDSVGVDSKGLVYIEVDTSSG